MSCPSASSSSNLRIAVLSGGDSSERAVSLESGRCVARALVERGHDVCNLDPADFDLATVLPAEFDVVLPMLHGTGAEDGQLQRLLETLNIAWVGSSSAASALTFSKSATRDLLHRHGLLVAPGFTLSEPIDAQQVQTLADQLGWPLVVKPDAEGSSVGISIINQPGQLSTALQCAWAWGRKVVIERYIPGREITVPVIDGIVFPTIEIIPASGWYDYAAKYKDDTTKYLVDPDGIPADIRLLASKAYGVCGVSGLSRIDFRLTPDGQLFILEINTIPGMTSHSLVPMSAAAKGLSLGQLCEQVCHAAIARYAAQAAT